MITFHLNLNNFAVERDSRKSNYHTGMVDITRNTDTNPAALIKWGEQMLERMPELNRASWSQLIVDDEGNILVSYGIFDADIVTDTDGKRHIHVHANPLYARH